MPEKYTKNKNMQTSQSPTVSVLLPTYNRQNYITDSVKSVLNQSYKDLELIIIDDGSTDDTQRVVQGIYDSRVRYVKNKKNLGLQKTLNKGISLSRGKYIARIDTQDRWIKEDKLKNQVKILNNNPGCVLIGTGAIVQDESGEELLRYLVPEKDAEIRSQILSKNPFVHVSVLMRKNAVLEVGGYPQDGNTKHAEDYALWLKLGLVGKYRNLNDYGVVYIDNKSGISRENKLAQIRANLRLIERYKDNFSGYYRALFRYYIRLVVYGYLELDFLSRITAYFSRSNHAKEK